MSLTLGVDPIGCNPKGLLSITHGIHWVLALKTKGEKKNPWTPGKGAAETTLPQPHPFSLTEGRETKSSVNDKSVFFCSFLMITF